MCVPMSPRCSTSPSGRRAPRTRACSGSRWHRWVSCSRLAAWPRRVTGLPVAASISARGASMARSRRSRRATSWTTTRRSPCWPRCGCTRRQPCWCGSGRQYKVCHLHREQLPLAERAAWLYQKAGADLFDGPSGPLLIQTAQARARFWDSPDALDRAIEDGLAADAVLFEGGAFADFLAVRGSLLPTDERLLAAQWLLVQRSVHEVLAVRRGEQMTLRDVRTGDVHEVRERAGSRQVKVGELYCARVVPSGDTMQIFGGIEPVSIGERDELIALLDDEPDPVELVAFLSRRFAPPVLQNTEGESLVLCDATLRIADPARLAQALDDEYDRHDDEPDGALAWFEHVITHGIERIRANIELRGDKLDVHANSEARFERVLARIGKLDPSATVLHETRDPAGDLRAVQQLD